MIKESREYKMILLFYGDRVAKRSQVPLMNHINEGLIVLDRISSSDAAKRAFCVHPMLQADEDLKANKHLYLEPEVMMLAMEYRSVANEFLSDKIPTYQDRDIRLSPLYDVNDMLVADKVQNYKDFITYHRGTHARSDELDTYFRKWLYTLDITENAYKSLCRAIDESRV